MRKRLERATPAELTVGLAMFDGCFRTGVNALHKEFFTGGTSAEQIAVWQCVAGLSVMFWMTVVYRKNLFRKVPARVAMLMAGSAFAGLGVGLGNALAYANGAPLGLTNVVGASAMYGAMILGSWITERRTPRVSHLLAIAVSLSAGLFLSARALSSVSIGVWFWYAVLAGASIGTSNVFGRLVSRDTEPRVQMIYAGLGTCAFSALVLPFWNAFPSPPPNAFDPAHIVVLLTTALVMPWGWLAAVTALRLGMTPWTKEGITDSECLILSIILGWVFFGGPVDWVTLTVVGMALCATVLFARAPLAPHHGPAHSGHERGSAPHGSTHRGGSTVQNADGPGKSPGSAGPGTTEVEAPDAHAD